MGQYDLTMKRLTAEFPEDYVRLALKTERFVVEPLEVEEVDRALPSLAREVERMGAWEMGDGRWGGESRSWVQMLRHGFERWHWRGTKKRDV